MDDGPLTITAAAELIRAGKLSPVELLDVCLRRIDRYEPRVKAWVYLDRDRARRDAEGLTAELAAGQNRGPLHGIPIGVKDIIDVFDMPTGCGSKLWANSYARQDASVVQRLREAGALILGKTVTTPYAYTDPPPTRNPWDPGRTPGGSSSGSAAAVACGMCLGALATQTGGSTTRPASYCGVYSLKPTHGRISTEGALPLAPTLDHVGLMANCVKDLIHLFQPVSLPGSGPGSVPDFLGELDRRHWLKGGRIACLGGMFDAGMTAKLRPLYSEAIHRLESHGTDPITLERTVPPPGFNHIGEAHLTVMATEAAQYHAGRLRARPEDYPPNIRNLVEDGSGRRAPGYFEAIINKPRLCGELVDGLGGGAFVTPATTDLPPTPETTGSPAFNSPWSFLGLPTVSLPAGWSETGLPYAIQLVGREDRELDLFAAAAWCERRLEFPRRPIPE